MPRNRLLFPIVSIFVFCLSLSAHGEERIRAGSSGIVNPSAFASFEQTNMRKIKPGDNVYHNETVSTDVHGQLQILFVDKTSLTLGPNSQVVIDEFVYDPQTDASEMALSLSKGILRFIGGEASKTNPVTIDTPEATIGIRGGIVIVRSTDDGLEAVFLYGDEMTVTPKNGGFASVTRFGYMVRISSDGKVKISEAPNEIIKELLNELEDAVTDETGEVSKITAVYYVEDELIDRIAEDPSLLSDTTNLANLEEELSLDTEKYEDLRVFIESLEDELLDAQVISVDPPGGPGTPSGGSSSKCNIPKGKAYGWWLLDKC